VVSKAEDVCNNTVVRRQAAGLVKLEVAACWTEDTSTFTRLITFWERCFECNMFDSLFFVLDFV
jgi:hypothetical protein